MLENIVFGSLLKDAVGVSCLSPFDQSLASDKIIDNPVPRLPGMITKASKVRGQVDKLQLGVVIRLLLAG